MSRQSERNVANYERDQRTLGKCAVGGLVLMFILWVISSIFTTANSAEPPTGEQATQQAEPEDTPCTKERLLFLYQSEYNETTYMLGRLESKTDEIQHAHDLLFYLAQEKRWFKRQRLLPYYQAMVVQFNEATKLYGSYQLLLHRRIFLVSSGDVTESEFRSWCASIPMYRGPAKEAHQQARRAADLYNAALVRLKLNYGYIVLLPSVTP